jgi:hypothetical protein
MPQAIYAPSTQLRYTICDTDGLSAIPIIESKKLPRPLPNPYLVIKPDLSLLHINTSNHRLRSYLLA